MATFLTCRCFCNSLIFCCMACKFENHFHVIIGRRGHRRRRHHRLMLWSYDYIVCTLLCCCLSPARFGYLPSIPVCHSSFSMHRFEHGDGVYRYLRKLLSRTMVSWLAGTAVVCFKWISPLGGQLRVLLGSSLSDLSGLHWWMGRFKWPFKGTAFFGIGGTIHRMEWFDLNADWTLLCSGQGYCSKVFLAIVRKMLKSKD